MGRAGSGGGHSRSGGFSSGGHSSSRSSGGHHVGSSHSRAGSSYSSYRGSRSYGRSYGNHYHGGFGGYRGHVYHGGSTFVTAMIMPMIIVIIAVMFAFTKVGNSSIPKSSYAREKIDANIGYNNNCIIDEIGWFDNISRTSKQLKEFYDKTGVQPYIVLRNYDSSLKTDSEKEDYARNYYEENIGNEGTFLFMYFAEQDVDNDVGYMAYVNGKQVTSVMDSEAMDIFWAYIDKYWYSDCSTDTLFELAFVDTADRIMDKTTTGFDIAIYIIIVMGVIAVGIIMFKLIKAKFKRDKEKAKETIDILNAPLDTSSKDDDILNKYK